MEVIRAIYIFLLLRYVFTQSSNFGLTLEKYNKITINIDPNALFGQFVFNSADFKDGEEMYFKIKAKNDTFLSDGIYYQYIDDKHLPDPNNMFEAKFDGIDSFETIGGISYQIKHVKIKKSEIQFKGADGNKIYMQVYMTEGGDIIIENTKEDEGKLPTWAIVVIVIAVVLVLVVMVGCYCYRRKKQLAMASMTTGQAVGVNQYDNQNMQPNNQGVVQYPQTNYDPNVQQYNQPISSY